MLKKKSLLRAAVILSVVGLSVLVLGQQAKAEPMLKAEPAAVELNPKALAGVKLIGSGFQAEDRIVIDLVGAPKGKDVPVATADADTSGSFETTMNMLSILQGIFNFRFQGGKPVPDPNNPPLPPGKYTLRASSWDSKLEASGSFEITAPQKK